MTPRKAKGQRTRATMGAYGRTVRVFTVDGAWKVHCRGLGVYRTFRGDDAEAMARGFADRLARGPEPEAPKVVSIAELWADYTASSDFTELRQRSQEVYREGWAYFTEVVPLETPADQVNATMLDTARRRLEDTPRPRAPHGLAVNTVRKALQVVKGVFTWAVRHDKLATNRTHAFRFKVSKDRRPVPPDEYTSEEFRALVGALSFDRPSQRTAYVVLALCGYQGARINAALHLRWEDVDLEAGALAWRAKWDKQGNEWSQPMRAPTRAVLARLWESVDRPTEGWVFPARKGSQSDTYTVQSFWWALREAEKRAGVEHRPRRAAHGFRRMVAGDLASVVSDGEAMRAIGDKDPRMAERYIKRRDDRVVETMRKLDARTG